MQWLLLSTIFFSFASLSGSSEPSLFPDDQLGRCENVKLPRRSAKEVRNAHGMGILSLLIYHLPNKRQEIQNFHLRHTNKRQPHLCRVRRGIDSFLRLFLRRRLRLRAATRNHCKKTKKLVMERSPFILRYWLHGWFEKTIIPGINFHETDLLVATHSSKTVVIAFAGTSSRKDHVTNLQTFEPANHSGLFYRQKGALHRGFLNAYSRVDRGYVHSLQTATNMSLPALSVLDPIFRRCTFDRENITIAVNDNEEYDNRIVTRRKRGGCFAKKQKLMNLLRDLVITSLKEGRTVHLTGHSLGGGLATLLALDVLVNFTASRIPVRRLHLWTFGAPHIADERFWMSALETVPRLEKFLSKRFRRFVTLYDQCRRLDFVSTLTARALAGQQQQRRFLRRRLAGVGTPVVHPMDPQYVPISANVSTLGAHSMVHYLDGLSKMSIYHPLSSTLPDSVMTVTENQI